MNAKSRILAIKLYDKIKRNTDYAAMLGFEISFPEKEKRRKM